MFPLVSRSSDGAQLTRELNGLLRRFRHYRTEVEWVSALLEGASYFVQQAAVFAVDNGVLRLRGQVNMSLPEQCSFAAASASAFVAAVDSRDPVIALRTAGEVGALLSAGEPGARAHIIPISNRERVVALLFAPDGAAGHGEALELVAGMASLVLERQANLSLHAQIGHAQMTGGAPFPAHAQSARRFDTDS